MMTLLGVGALAAAIVVAPPMPPEPTLTPLSRKMVVDQAARAIEETYQDPAKAVALAADLRARMAAGGFDNALTPGDLAQELTTRLRAASRDLHLGVSDPLRPLPIASFTPPPSSVGGFGRVDLSPGGIGYVRMVAFPPIAIFRPAADFELARLKGAKVIILDLRTSLGGDPQSAAYLDGFFDSRARNGLDDAIVRVRGTDRVRAEPIAAMAPPFGLADTKLYVLIGPKTFSAPEQAAYDLQQLRRATLVGARTGGGAHPTERIGIGANLFMSVPFGSTRSRLTGGNWEVVGVQPDVATPHSDALRRALIMAGVKAARADILTMKLGSPYATSNPRLDVAETKLRTQLVRRAAGESASAAFPIDLDDFASTPPPPAVMRRWGAILSITPKAGPNLFGERDFEVVFKNVTTDWVVYLLPDGTPGPIGFHGRRISWPIAGSSQASAGLGVLDAAEAVTRECYSLIDMQARVRGICVPAGEERRVPVGWDETACRIADEGPPSFPCYDPALAGGILLAEVATNSPAPGGR